MLENKHEKYGYNSGIWNGPLMIDFNEKQFGIKYKKAQIYNIFKSFGFSYQKSRGFYPEADKEAKENFRNALKKFQDSPIDTVLLFEDEFSLSNTATVSYQ